MGHITSVELSRLLRDGRAVVDDFDSWTARLALTVALDDALRTDELRSLLAGTTLTPHDAAHAVLRSDTALAAVRLEQARAQHSAYRDSLSAVDVGWFTVSAAPTVVSLSALRLSWANMPLLWRLLAVLGLISAVMLSIRIIVHRLPGVFGMPPRYPAETESPHEQQLVLGDRRRIVVTEIVLPAIRAFVQRHPQRVYGTTLRFSKVKGLYGHEDAAVVSTRATSRLRRIIERADSGAIALAGSRGVGKSTAIRSIGLGVFTSPEKPPPLLVRVEAPNRYDGRDFVLYLHAQFCKEVASAVSQALRKQGSPHRLEADEIRRSARVLASFLLSAAAALGTALLLWGSPPADMLSDLRLLIADAIHHLPGSLTVLWSGQSVGRIVALGAIGLVVVRSSLLIAKGLVTAAGIALHRSRQRRTRRLKRLRREALNQLDRVRFLQTFTTGWSGKLAMPLKGEATRTRSIQRVEQQLTHPEVVDQFRRFATFCAKTLNEQQVTNRVVVAIDELDKIEQPAQAQEFVNDIKGVFDVARCLFVVSVSDDAITNFEQRGLAIRDAFDSAFSEMLRLEHFDLEDSYAWLTQRLIDVPVQFCALCHCLSGGLPRDLRRYTIEMVDVAATVYEPSLATVTEALVRRELGAKSRAFNSTVKTMEQTSELPTLATDLLLISEHSNAEEMLELAQRFVGRATRLEMAPCTAWDGTAVASSSTARRCSTSSATNSPKTG